MEVDDGIIIQVILVKELEGSWLLDYEGYQKWFPKSKCKYNCERRELEAPRWLLKYIFPGEKF